MLIVCCCLVGVIINLRNYQFTKNTMKITFICGLPGSGKTTLGNSDELGENPFFIDDISLPGKIETLEKLIMLNHPNNHSSKSGSIKLFNMTHPLSATQLNGCEFCSKHFNRPSDNDTWECPYCKKQWAGLKECLVTLICEGYEIKDNFRVISHDGQLPDGSEVYTIVDTKKQGKSESNMQEFKTPEEAVEEWLKQ